jgi:hypothetical protein
MYKCVLLSLIIIIVSYMGHSDIEAFTSGMRQMYRPYVRKARILSEGFRDKQTQKISNLLRRIGFV